MIGTPAREQRSLQPSTFASRHSDRAARGDHEHRSPRLVSVGTGQQRVEAAGRFQKAKLVTFEYLQELGDSSRRYVRAVPHGELQPLFDTRPTDEREEILIPDAKAITERLGYGSDPAPEPLGVVSAKWTGRLSYAAARSDPAPQRIS
jgi:hypothetical protein